MRNGKLRFNVNNYKTDSEITNKINNIRKEIVRLINPDLYKYKKEELMHIIGINYYFNLKKNWTIHNFYNFKIKFFNFHKNIYIIKRSLKHFMKLIYLLKNSSFSINYRNEYYRLEGYFLRFYELIYIRICNIVNDK